MTDTQPDNHGAEQLWPGQRLGLPDQGPRSIARAGRRLLALCLDWGIAVLLSYAFFRGDALAIAIIFAVLQVIFISVLGGSVGHLALGLRLVPLQPGVIGFVKPLVRTVLLALLIPAVIWDRDQRGLHDKAANTVLVRR
ncbi:RDD family protein [Glaciihabitans arcticus]|uniref:RDD family protein n=1 Tax=Glaciihabitans arcticus TaxID=2668039 RepID=A0A4V6MTN0_9MICO|nr:RDD family protein [Glaciihabitans arcticus]TBN56849.1 RDD family protein [Glaciihabitans arcticus]